MASGAYLDIVKGDDYSFTANVAVDNVASNLYGSAVWFQVWGDPSGNFNDRSLLVNASTNAGSITITGSNSNVVTVTLNGNATANYDAANVAEWSLRAQLSSGRVYTLDRGQACIRTPIVSLPWS